MPSIPKALLNGTSRQLGTRTFKSQLELGLFIVLVAVDVLTSTSACLTVFLLISCIFEFERFRVEELFSNDLFEMGFFLPPFDFLDLRGESILVTGSGGDWVSMSVLTLFFVYLSACFERLGDMSNEYSFAFSLYLKKKKVLIYEKRTKKMDKINFQVRMLQIKYVDTFSCVKE